jgi:O-antigen/teichoic acid export membrane protein
MNIASLIGSTLMQVLPLFTALYYSNSLFDIILAVLIGRLISLIFFTYFVMKLIPLNLSYNKYHVSRLIRFGAWVSVSSILQPILMLTDRFILAYKLGAASVTHYVVPYNLASKLSIVPNSLASVLFPRFSMESDNSNQLMITSRIALVAIMTPLVIVSMIATTYFFPFWLGEVGNKMVFVAQVLLVGF